MKFEFDAEDFLIPRVNPWWGLAFDHIPKCGGTSFGHYIEKLYEPPEIYPSYIAGSLSGVDCTKHKYVRGHFFAEEIYKLPNVFAKITLLRDPVKRVVSNYLNWADTDRHDPNFLAEAQRHPEVLEALALAASRNPSEFFQSHNPSIKFMVDNYMTRHFLGYPESGDLSSMHVHAAFENLKKYFSFGLLEAFEESVILISFQLGIASPPMGTIPSLNVKKAVDSFEMPSDVIQYIERVNQFDIQLYTAAKALFRKRYQSFVYLAAKLARQRFVRVLDDKHDRVTSTTVVNISAENFDESSWWFLELTEQEPKREFRWTGFSVFSVLDVPFTPTVAKSISVTLTCLADSVTKENVRTLQLCISHTWHPVTVQDCGETLTVKAMLCCEEPHVLENRLELKIRSNVKRVKDVDDEYRSLGVAVESATFEIRC